MTFIVTSGNSGNLLSYKTSVCLGIINRINSNSVESNKYNSVHTVNTEKAKPNKYKAKYFNLYADRVGSYNSYKAKSHVNETVRPIQQTKKINFESLTAVNNDSKVKKEMKMYTDDNLNDTKSKLIVKDLVYLRSPLNGKLIPIYDPSPFEIVSIKGNKAVIVRGQQRLQRNLSLLKKVSSSLTSSPQKSTTVNKPTLVGLTSLEPTNGNTLLSSEDTEPPNRTAPPPSTSSRNEPGKQIEKKPGVYGRDESVEGMKQKNDLYS